MRISNLERRPENTPPPASSDSETIVREVENRRSNSCNVVVYNFPDKPNSADLDEFNDLLTSEELSLCSPAHSAFRIGKQIDNKPRPLKVRFTSESQARAILKKCRVFAAKNLVVKNDLTFEQRLFLKRLNSELNRRIENGEQDITIRYVKNIPTIVPKQKN